MDSLDDFMQTRPPTAARPLLGLTVLVVEDSRFASEAMRLLCLRSGARIRRADSLHHAQRHLAVYRPAVVIIDLGLPDGSGVDLIRDLTQGASRVEVVFGTSGDPDGERLAIKAGADGFMAKPVSSIGYFQSKVLEHLPADRQPKGLRALNDEVIVPDEVALRDDLEAAAIVLEDATDHRSLRYLTQFLGGIARSVDDAPLEREMDALANLQTSDAALQSQVARVAAMVQDRIARTSPI
ncbi:Response regulator receiver domain-containing protein [Octadecabacter temperatus]|uniref:KDP operon transcriptional regulatory protein KdpE n=1 Tax=Octadecabacter temperatus TaxID=1458307 RepID=A0A0K0Y7N9_9RHOB|nr:response regulator [Octadecabacter temperatus]AKS46901.1 KDP operon transcriptional regulatory protein KdpE [Octadecabacter temperatus]SIO23355.1 Response regulator receiver domain-containing protein [Octadecabacter temperatus]